MTKYTPSAIRIRAESTNIGLLSHSSQSNNWAKNFATVSPIFGNSYGRDLERSLRQLQAPKRTKWVKYFVLPVLRYIFVRFITTNKVLTFMVNMDGKEVEVLLN